MSLAGIRSNRGDSYQTYIAFDLALNVLSQPEYLQIEIDSTKYPIDDIVVEKTDGTIICCQCKKNQKDFNAWTMADLEDELAKAVRTLDANKQTVVRFYSRGNFGQIAKLKEFSTSYSDEAQFSRSLTNEHTATTDSLSTLIGLQSSSITVFEFLQRTSFYPSQDFEQLEILLRERLDHIVSNSTIAYNVMWTMIDQLGARINSGNTAAHPLHSLTKENIRDALEGAGAIITPKFSTKEVQDSFAGISAIGRFWKRDIFGITIHNNDVDKILLAIHNNHRSILVTGIPGSGKTCTILTLQEKLEALSKTQSNLFPIFIQSREYANAFSTIEREAIGLPTNWVEKAARLAERGQVVVVIDSLDVLSIAREHEILTYFLAQIDRLLLIPNITVVTACREFDKKYDQRISARNWDCEISCQPLCYETQIEPLLIALGIDSTNVDRKLITLIKNPRELALFVELAKRGDAYIPVSSISLSQRYLETIVINDAKLGNAAFLLLQKIAEKMLQSRSLSIPKQQFIASDEMRRRLVSLNILQYTQSEKITFGHQTLLDAIVIYGAKQSGLTLNGFIQSLPQVPFVRPSIRLYVAELAANDRSDFRKQIRATLQSNIPFHLRRLIAESFSQIAIQDGDWSFVRDLYNGHRDVFQVVYNNANGIDWHFFWLKNLIPYLIENKDAQGLVSHIFRVSYWKNESPESVVRFWNSALELSWLDTLTVTTAISQGITGCNTDAIQLAVPLLKRLLRMPMQQYTSLGISIAQAIKNGLIDDLLLWEYLTRDLNDEAASNYNFISNIHCQPHEFGDDNENFIDNCFQKSTALLDIAISSIERWSKIRANRFGQNANYSNAFLNFTSYDIVHSNGDHFLRDEHFFFNAIEKSLLNHAKIRSQWWQENKFRIVFSFEESIRYFALLALAQDPEENTETIGLALCDVEILESDLNFEICNLIRESFHHLNTDTQHEVIKSIAETWNSQVDNWAQKRRIEYFKSIPCHLRSMDSQSLIDAYQTAFGPLTITPSIQHSSGIVKAPFGYDVFLNSSPETIIRLLKHYSDYTRDYSDYLTGGKEEVIHVLREASSRHPLKFIGLLEDHFLSVQTDFVEAIIHGVASNINYRFGNLQQDQNWIEAEVADEKIIEDKLLAILEKNSSSLKLTSSAAQSLLALAHIINTKENADRHIALTQWYLNSSSTEKSDDDHPDLISKGINSKFGIAGESAFILANRFYEKKIPAPSNLAPTMIKFVSSRNSVIQALILRRLPQLQSLNPELGWELFEYIIENPSVWRYSDLCLYYAYQTNFNQIAPLLDKMYNSDSSEDLEVWGRICALSSLAGNIDISSLISRLDARNNPSAWDGAAKVWSNTSNLRQHLNQCLLGLESGLKADEESAQIVASKLTGIFRDSEPPILIPFHIIDKMFAVIGENQATRMTEIFGFHKWLNAVAKRNPLVSICILERYVKHRQFGKPYFYDHDNQIVKLLTSLFAEAEEYEESDQGNMLARVVELQDQFLALGLHSINEWLKDAERQ